jgi:hypothetical protein
MQDFLNETLGMYGQSHVVDGSKNVEVKFVHHAGRLWKCVGERDGVLELVKPYNTIAISAESNKKYVNVNEVKYI